MGNAILAALTKRPGPQGVGSAPPPVALPDVEPRNAYREHPIDWKPADWPRRGFRGLRNNRLLSTKPDGPISVD